MRMLKQRRSTIFQYFPMTTTTMDLPIILPPMFILPAMGAQATMQQQCRRQTNVPRWPNDTKPTKNQPNAASPALPFSNHGIRSVDGEATVMYVMTEDSYEAAATNTVSISTRGGLISLNNLAS